MLHVDLTDSMLSRDVRVMLHEQYEQEGLSCVLPTLVN